MERDSFVWGSENIFWYFFFFVKSFIIFHVHGFVCHSAGHLIIVKYLVIVTEMDQKCSMIMLSEGSIFWTSSNPPFTPSAPLFTLLNYQQPLWFFFAFSSKFYARNHLMQSFRLCWTTSIFLLSKPTWHN